MDAETIHKFERAGLGKAPFRYLGCFEDRGPHRSTDPKTGIVTECGSPGQPMGTCEYCGQGIALCCSIVSADGKRFIVGSDCVAKTGDAGLVKLVKREGAARGKEREAQRIGDMRARLDGDFPLAVLLASQPHPQQWARDQGQTLLNSILWMMENAGHSGRLKTVRQIEKLEKGTQ